MVGSQYRRTMGGDVVVIEAANAKIVVVEGAEQHLSQGHKTGVQAECIVAMSSIQKMDVLGPFPRLIFEEDGGDGFCNDGSKGHGVDLSCGA